MIRIGFFGTPSLAASVLSDIVGDMRFEIDFVVTNPDKPFGRDQVMKPSPVKEYALSQNIPVLQPMKIRGNIEFLDEIRSYNCDYFIVVAYGKILPLELLQIPKKMCINVHGSILPLYRGASPIQAALLHGEQETGVTIMEMSEGMDEGDILKIRTIPIDERETSGTLFEKFAQISGKTLIDTLLELEHGGITPLPQDHEHATYCKKIEKEDGLIDWTLSADEIYHKWQAYTPWPGIFTYYEGKRLLLEKLSLFRHREEGCATKGSHTSECEHPTESVRHISGVRDSEKQKGIPHSDWIASQARNDGNQVGQVTRLDDGGIGIVCGQGILTLEQVKLEGKKSQSIKDFVNGNQGFISYKLYK